MAKLRITKSIVPNLLTLVNLYAGFSAIVYISKGDIEKGALFILIAAIFDMLDGVMARLINATSEFGAELDSLCDVVSFGVAPSFMLYQVFFTNYNEIGILFAALPALAGASRLARFNIQLTDMIEDKLYFKGLPIPSAALTIVSYIIFILPNNYMSESMTVIATFTLVIFVAYAMISDIRFDNIPRPNKKSFRERPVVSIIFAIGMIASVVSKGIFVFPFMIFYIVASGIRHLIRFFQMDVEPEEEIDDAEEN
jgi:CDP-diacylglycerol---serine O-phosphatidyltransferase